MRQLGRGRRRGFEVLAVSSFVGLGLPDGMIGTAWPTIHRSLGVPVADLGLVLLAVTLGSVAISAFTGRILQRVGVGALMALASGIFALAACGIAVSPKLWAMLVAAAPLGVAAGFVDGGLNTEIAMSARLRLLNLLHGFYSVGTAVGPLVVTAALLAGSWRPAYLVLVAVELALAFLWWSDRRQLAATANNLGDTAGAGGPPGPVGATGAPRPAPGGAAPNRRRRREAVALAGGMAVFFFYTGLEVAAGQWEATFCRLQLGFSTTDAGLAVFAYFGSLTAVRLALGMQRRPPAAAHIVWSGMALAMLGAGLVWWRPTAGVAVAGFVVLGASLAGVFPALVLLTPDRLGDARARHAIAWQVGAASVGGSGLSALIGVAIDAEGVGVLGVSITVLAIVVFLANAALSRIAPADANGLAP